MANFLFAFPAYWLIDRRGRRFLLLTTLPLMTISILAAGLSFLIPNPDGHNPAYVIVIGLFTYIFVALYSIGLGPVPFTYSAECFPLEVRMVGMSLAVSTNLLGAGLLALFVPVLTAKLGHLPLLGIFAALNVFAFILVFLFVPETAGAVIANDPANADGRLTAMSLEELNYVFGIKTERHMEYQCEEVFRDYFWKRYVVRDKTWSRPRKFYMWQSDRVRSRGDTLSVSTTRDDQAQIAQAQETQRVLPRRIKTSNHTEERNEGGVEIAQNQPEPSRQENAQNARAIPQHENATMTDTHVIAAGEYDC